MIVYFSGTGNSRYAADMLADLLDDVTFDSTDCIKNGSPAQICSEKPLVFVCPTYVSAPPLVFMDFIRKAEFTGCKKVWTVITCAGGSGAGAAYMKKLCCEKGLEFMGCEQLQMPQNYLLYFKIKDKNENDQTILEAEKQIRLFAQRIREGKAFTRPEPKKWETISTQMILKPYYKVFISARPFCTTDKCISCGRCASLCPLGNIRMKNGRPVWSDNCTHCMACIASCPKGAIEYGKKTQGKKRYYCKKYASGRNVSV
ncbi:MAG: EFR1 family ferrodoxin [Eubacteriales bacterium]|nr:EFR1 family ferrodoxin [Eubacteriales bacterium]